MPPPSAVQLDLLRRYATLLDTAFRIPGTSIRFGLDAVLGLVPGVGDLASPIFTAVLLVTGVQMGVPPVVLARMAFNAALDTLIGLVPVAGDLADVAWKANVRNLALLERHAMPGVRATTSDYLFVGVCLAIVAVVGLVPIVLVAWVLSQLA